jgi:hypothetical protein
MRRFAIQTVLWAGPLGIGLAVLLLLANAPYFRSGPGVPTAGDARAWGAMWGALGLVGLGSTVGFVASVWWAAIAMRQRRRPSLLEWIRTVTGLVIGAACAAVWFQS